MRRAAVTILVLALSLAFLPPVDASPAVPPSPRWTFHAPIVIVGDSNFTLANGVVGGSGSANDPYVIAGWDLDANSTYGVWVRSTAASFVIRDSFVHGGHYGFSGIRLENVSYGLVTNVTFASTAQFSLVVSGSSYVNVTRNYLTGEDPLAIYRSHDSGISNNTVKPSTTGVGIEISESARILAKGNFVFRPLRGIEAYSSDNVTIEDNTIVGAYWFSVSLTFSTAITVRRNTMAAWGLMGPSGIEVNVPLSGDADTHTITPDNLIGGLPVLYYKDCRNATIEGVRLGQLILSNCQGVVVTNVTLGFTDWSFAGVLTIINSWNWTLTRSNFYGLSFYHSGVHGDQDGRVFLNNIYGAGLNGNPLAASLNEPYPLGGNYWAGYAGQDQCSGPSQNVCPDPDGFGDTPAAIDVSGGIEWIGTDALPRMKPVDLANTPPVASARASPSVGTPSTSFAFNASGSDDAQDAAPALEVRWDWNGDGIWDTNWSTTKSAVHTFPSEGTYAVGLEVRDTDGWLALTSLTVVVRPEPYAFLLQPWFVVLAAAIGFAAMVMILRQRRRRRTVTEGEEDSQGPK